MLELCILIAGFVISFILAFGIGANDVANSFGTSVGSKVLTVTRACILATIFEISGALLIGHKVSDTMRKGILDVTIYENQTLEYMLGCLSSLSASAIWLIVATFIKLPISGTHSIVGATVGFSLISHGTHGINWRPLGEIVASWFISPVASGMMSVLISFLINHFILLRDSPLEPGLRALPFIYGLTVFVNVFSIINDGPKLLYMDKIGVWRGVLITLSISAVIMIVVFKVLVPFLRKKIESALDPKESMTAKATSEHQHEKFSKIDIEAITDENKTEVIVKKDNNNADVNGQAIAKDTILTKLFTFLQILTAMFGSFAHGGNDVSNAIGPMIALFLTFENQSVSQNAETPIWILLYGGIGISIGLWVWGRRVIQTIGDDLTKIVPWTGFAIEFGSALTVLLASKMGYPVSTTHCKVGSVVFVGYASSNGKGVDWKLFRNIISAWVITVPVSALFSALIMFILSKIFL